MHIEVFLIEIHNTVFVLMKIHMLLLTRDEFMKIQQFVQMLIIMFQLLMLLILAESMKIQRARANTKICDLASDFNVKSPN
jgi:hypothetical protein